MLPIHTILLPTDFSPCSETALHLAGALARDYTARLVVLHAEPVPLAPPIDGVVAAPIESAHESVAEMLAAIDVPGVVVEHRLAQGNPVTAICDSARDLPCDLIVMGTHGRGGLGRLVMGSTAEGVLRAAPCPVLTVKSLRTLAAEDATPTLEPATV